MADFIKPSPYNNCAGPRLAQYIRNVQSTIFRDMAPEEVLQMTYKMMGLSDEPTLDKLPTRDCRARRSVWRRRRPSPTPRAGSPSIPASTSTSPPGSDEKRTRPEDVEAATAAALDAGAPGVVLSRKYAEMRLTNIAGAKRALQAHAGEAADRLAVSLERQP